MRIAELSRRSGVPVPTIKFYLREGLLPPGERTGPNQAYYAEEHVRALLLVRALVDVGGLSIAAVREVLEAMNSEPRDPHRLMGVVHQRLGPEPAPTADADAEDVVDALLSDMGWQSEKDTPAARALVTFVATATELGHPGLPALLLRYAKACEQIAEIDLDYVTGLSPLERVLEGVVVGTVIGDAAISALRRLAQSVEAHRRSTAP